MPESDDIRVFVGGIVEQMFDRERILTITIHRNYRRIFEIFPEARIVHLLRDPRDVGRSSIGMSWNGNVYHGVDHWIASEREMAALRAARPDADILTVRYEDLVSNAERELGRVCAFFGDVIEPSMFDYVKNSTYGLPDASFAEQWRRKLTQKELGLLEGKLGDLLGAGGYAPSGAPVLKPRPLRQAWLGFEDRFGRFRAVAGRYGLGPVLMETLGRRFGIDPLRRAGKRRIDELEVKYLK